MEELMQENIKLRQEIDKLKKSKQSFLDAVEDIVRKVVQEQLALFLIKKDN